MSDDEAINYLIKLKMIGPWTAMMLFALYSIDQIFGQPIIKRHH